MSADGGSPRPLENDWTLGQYISALIEATGFHHPHALARMRRVVGFSRARIRLDEEAVDVSFEGEELVIQPVTQESPVEGEGATDSATVLALLDGNLEVTDAILNGRLHVTGRDEEIAKMFNAIEILLDVSPRTPALQSLAERFRRQRRDRRDDRLSNLPGIPWYPFALTPSEQALLRRLRLLPENHKK